MFLKRAAVGVLALLLSSGAWAAGNERIDSFSDAKKKLENHVYKEAASRVTIYCGAKYDQRKYVKRPDGFKLPLNRDGEPMHVKRAQRIEWEHVVPAENFGRALPSGETVIRCVWKRAKRLRGANVQKKPIARSNLCKPTCTTCIRPLVP